ncbi:MarR family winged helix-turn-helix transcriptional regulator [Flectobacillus sp. DC10W]|jgi:DNA-binding MarR family transcriptional regulator|uniref:MarR family winged helix-turn-helix transcriptional regulator n=1 Tax=Flectobacillus longus TaxID=2984207 RepID=A0ABT6YHX9_9BACT|nr:MarR family winged helix-turn-helix transcriptional regulator [Flectobacillus longus]MDI9863192.1 MarR family winged helix-turn-helix transcriptional regulator [Flectobacillus longus]
MTEDDIIKLKQFRDSKNRLMGRLLNRSYRYMSTLAVKFLNERGYNNFRVGQIVALVNIDVEGTSVNKIAQKASMTKQGMSKLIKELVDEGYVYTEKDPSDARALIVKLTDLGVRCILDWKACTEYIDQNFEEVIGAEKLDILKDILRTLVDKYEQLIEIGEVTCEPIPLAFIKK